MSNAGCILVELIGQCHGAHLSKVLMLLASELGRRAFLSSRKGLAKLPGGAALQEEVLAQAWSLH